MNQAGFNVSGSFMTGTWPPPLSYSGVLSSFNAVPHETETAKNTRLKKEVAAFKDEAASLTRIISG